MTRLRLCVAVECTHKASSVWPTTLAHVVEPLLALAEASSAGAAAPTLQLALILFGALPPHSGAAVESVLGWCASVLHFRRLLDSLDFAGGGGRQPVMLAHALAEVAALFAAADAASGGSGGQWQQHCLVCLASEPAVQPVSWPFAEDCCMARLPGLATSLELVRALRRRGVQLSLAGGDMQSNELLLLHLANCISDVPFSLSELQQEQRASRPDGVLQRTRRCMRVLPGRGMAFLPFWPEAAEAVQKLGFLPLAADTSLGSLEPVAPDPEDAAAKPGRGDAAAVTTAAVSAAAEAAARQDASPAAPPQWTPPLAGYPTPPTAADATPPVVDASPGSFWDVMKAEICSPELDAAAGTPAIPSSGLGMQQPLAPAPAQQQGRPEPTVQGLPLPPGMQAHQAQQAQQQLGAHGLQHQTPASGSVVVHTAQVVADQKVMGGAPFVLGVGTVHAMLKDAAAAQALGWPPELHIAKTLARAAAESFLDSKRSACLVTRLKIQYAHPEAENIPRQLLATKAAGAISMPGNYIGVLLPKQHPATQQIFLQLVVVPQG